jgi:hypothetical protein
MGNENAPLDLLGGGTVCYYRLLAEKLHSLRPECGVLDAVYITALGYMAQGEWVSEITEAMYEETALAAEEQKAIRQRLKELGVLEYSESTGSGVLRFRVSGDALVDVLAPGQEES